MNKIIILDGISTEEVAEENRHIQEVAEKHNIQLIPMYHSFGLKGTIENVEAVTLELWNMPRDQWEENALSIV